MRTTHKFSRGVSMVEAMVALAVMAFGMLAVVGVQSTLRLNADIAKQRSEATRMAQEKLDEWRSFTVIDTVPPAGQTAWSAIADDVSTVTGSNATYEVRREVVDHRRSADQGGSGHRELVRSGRSGCQRQEPACHVGQLHRCRGAWPVRHVGGSSRHRVGRPGATSVQAPSVDPRASARLRHVERLRSAWPALDCDRVQQCHWRGDRCLHPLPPARQTTPSRPAMFSRAPTSLGQLLTGFVRFERSISGPDLTAADVENPIGPALNLRMQLNLTSNGHPQDPVCFDDMTGAIADDGSKAFATYFCVVYSNSSLLWSGISHHRCALQRRGQLAHRR